MILYIIYEVIVSTCNFLECSDRNKQKNHLSTGQVKFFVKSEKNYFILDENNHNLPDGRLQEQLGNL